MKISKERVEEIARQLTFRFNTSSIDVAAAATNVAMLEKVADKLDELISKIDAWHPEPVVEAEPVAQPATKKSLFKIFQRA